MLTQSSPRPVEIFFYPIPINPNATLTTTGTWQKGAEDNTIETTVTSGTP